MKKIYLRIVLSMLFLFITFFFAFSQTFIRYNTWTGASGCNIFSDPNNSSTVINVPCTVDATNTTIPHLTALGQPTYDNTAKTVNLVSEIKNGQNQGTEYRITVNFKQNYSYKITITAARVMSQQTGANVLLRTDLNNGGSGSNNQCNGTAIIDASGSGNLKRSLPVTNSTFSTADTNYVYDYPFLSAAQAYLMIAAVPPAASVLQTIFIRRIKIEETPPPITFTLTPNPIPVTCGTTTPVVLTVNNVYSSPGVTGYTWNLGANNTWQYNGSPAPSSIPTFTNTLTLSPTCGVAPTSITATATIGSSSYQANTANISLTIPTMSINGSGEFCSGTSNYTIDNLPCNASVSWSVYPSNANIVSLSCTSCSSTTLTKTGNGIVTLIATITACGGSPIVKTKAITVGAAVPLFPPMPEICEGPFELCVPPIENTISHQWVARVPGSLNVTLQETSDWCVEVPAQALWVDLTIVNSCGSSTTRFRVTYSNCGSFLMASPNPGTNQINLTALKGASFEQVRIYDKLGNLRKQFKFIKGTKSATLNISELSADMYKVQAFDGTKWININIIKQ